MKTATITFHAPNNNGSFLQAYALQQVLSKQVHVENEILNYRSEKQTNQYKVFRTIKSKNDLLKNVVSLTHPWKLASRYRKFEDMRSTYLKQTKVVTEVGETLALASEYDVVVAGSDQIWNTGAPDFSEAYLLPGVPTKKIAFSVSCGSYAAESALKSFAEAVNAFNAISVRENTVAEQIKNVYQGNVAVTLDPTLLLDSNEYDVLYDKKPIIAGDYIFFYSINYEKSAMDALKKLSEETGLIVYTVFTSFHTLICEKYGVKVLYDGGPAEFLNLINNAKYVATNSFHGTAFSIIFRKNFYYLCKVSEGRVIRDDRIDGILDFLQIGNRNYSKIDTTFEKSEISYTTAEKKLAKARKESIDWLKNKLME